MKFRSIITAVFGCLLAFPAVAGDNHPCHPKREAKHAAHRALHECLEAWSRDKDADPTDDCAAKLSAFVAAAKDLRACHVEHKKK